MTLNRVKWNNCVLSDRSQIAVTNIPTTYIKRGYTNDVHLLFGLKNIDVESIHPFYLVMGGKS